MPSLLIIADEGAPEESILASRRVLSKYYAATFLRAHPTIITGNPTEEELADAACIVFSSPEMFLRLAGLPDIATRNIAIADTLLDCVSMNQYHDGQRKAVSVLAPLISASLAAAGTPSSADGEELTKLRRYYREITEFLGTDNVFGVVGALRAEIESVRQPVPVLAAPESGEVNLPSETLRDTQEDDLKECRIGEHKVMSETDIIVQVAMDTETKQIPIQDPVVAEIAAEMAGAESLEVPSVMETLTRAHRPKKKHN
jgi:hypothetical protein